MPGISGISPLLRISAVAAAVMRPMMVVSIYFESVAFARLPTSREYVVGDARHLRNLAALAHFRRGSRCHAAHDGGVDVGEEVHHQRFAFFVQDQKIHGPIPPRNIAVKGDSESEDDFS